MFERLGCGQPQLVAPLAEEADERHCTRGGLAVEFCQELAHRALASARPELVDLPRCRGSATGFS
jgi:hypothetical protein